MSGALIGIAMQPTQQVLDVTLWGLLLARTGCAGVASPGAQRTEAVAIRVSLSTTLGCELR